MKIILQRFGYSEENNKKARQNNLTNQIVLFLIVFIIIALVMTYAIAIFTRNNISKLVINETLDSVWIGSLASYLGGTLGGIFSGVFAFLGVFYTIKYYKKSDEEKERTSIQPFLLITSGSNTSPHKGFTLKNSSEDVGTTEKVNITIKNIGNGFATILVIKTGYIFGGLKYNKVLTVNSTDVMFLKVNSTELVNGINFDIQFIDARRNEYIQTYTIKSQNNHIDIDCGYPVLL